MDFWNGNNQNDEWVDLVCQFDGWWEVKKWISKDGRKKTDVGTIEKRTISQNKGTRKTTKAIALARKVKIKSRIATK